MRRDRSCIRMPGRYVGLLNRLSHGIANGGPTRLSATQANYLIPPLKVRIATIRAQAAMSALRRLRPDTGVAFAQKAVIPRRLGERVKSTRRGGFHRHHDWAVNNAKRKLCFDAPPRLPRKEGSRWQPGDISQFIESQPRGAAPSGLSQSRPANSLASASMKTRTFAARCLRCG
jgi:hypothetical protein